MQDKRTNWATERPSSKICGGTRWKSKEKKGKKNRNTYIQGASYLEVTNEIIGWICLYDNEKAQLCVPGGQILCIFQHNLMVNEAALGTRGVHVGLYYTTPYQQGINISWWRWRSLLKPEIYRLGFQQGDLHVSARRSWIFIDRSWQSISV